MDKPVLIVFYLAAIFSLRLNEFFVKNPFVNSGDALAVEILVDNNRGNNSVAPIVSPGLQILDFKANRTTFGFSDSNYTQPFNPNLANKKVALGCDSVAISITAVVAGISVNDSLGIKISYGNPNGSTASAEVFLFDQGQINFTKGGNSSNCTISPSAVSVNSVSGVKTLNFNLHNCLTGLGITLQSGDTLRFTGKFSVNPNGPLTPLFNVVPNFKAFAYATQNGVGLSCDTLSETFTLSKSQVVFDFPNTINGLPSGCAEGKLNWRLFVPNNNFSTYFGSELRASTKVDSLVFDFNPGLLTAFTGGVVEVSIPGHPVHGSSYFPIRPLSDFPNGHYVAKFDTLTRVPSLNLVQNYTFDMRLKLTPTCSSAVGSQAGTNIYSLQSKVTYTDRYYAHSIGDGSCVNVQTDQASSTVAYTQPPTFTLAPVTSAIASNTNGTVTWDLKLCNTSSQSNSGVNWLAVDDPSGLLTITSIANITVPANPVQLNLMTYGQNAFAFTPGINAGQCLTLRITATTTSCDDVSIQARTGWNCKPYANGWTPANNNPCNSISLPLMVHNSGVAPIQIDFSEVTSACNGAGEEVTVLGRLTSASALPLDTYKLSFIWDENADGNAQPNELVVASQTVSGSITPINPLIFSQLLQVQASQACQILLKVESSGGSGCSSITGTLPIPRFKNAGNDQFVCNVSNLFAASLGNGTVCDTTNYKTTWTAIAPAAIGSLDNPNIANPILTINPSSNLGQTLRYVVATERLLCGIATYDTVQIFVPASNGGVFSEAQMNLQVADCQSLASVCAVISPMPLSNFVFTDNGQVYTGTLPGCNGGFSVQLGPGLHQLIAKDTVFGCADTVQVNVTCTSTDTLQINLLLGETDTICVTSAQLSGSIISLSNICLGGQFVGYQSLNDSCVVLAGNLLGQETACLVACDANGFCDTTVLLINVLHPFPNGIFDTLTLTQTGQYCFDESQLNLVGTLESIQNLCPDAGNFVQFVADTNIFCLDYTAIGVGTATSCIELCDDLGNCDTVNYTVTVVPGNVIRDTVFLLLETDTFCLPPAWLPGPVVSITDVCPNNNGDNVNFSVQGTCILYSGFAVGSDIACYRFEDAFGNVALVELQIFVRRTYPDTFCDTIFIGQSKLHCLDVSELPGNFANGSIKEICPGERTGKVQLTINQSGKCVYYEGLTEGRDSSCIVFCDQFGFCDTTYFCFFVKPYFDPPTLGADTTSTLKGTPVVIDFLANDTIYGGIVDIYVLDAPVGAVVLNLDNSFTYIPKEANCDFWDNFTYVACNPNGCDTTHVSIFVNCIELTVFTAVSPNNDGVNDFFYIAKIEDFPDNHVWVYNIWGSLVYETTVYRNNWPGTWGADTDLPDGTYYYILEWKDNESKIVQKGFIELFR